VAPPFVVRRIVPFAPLAQASAAFTQLTAARLLPVPEVSAVQAPAGPIESPSRRPRSRGDKGGHEDRRRHDEGHCRPAPGRLPLSAHDASLRSFAAFAQARPFTLGAFSSAAYGERSTPATSGGQRRRKVAARSVACGGAVGPVRRSTAVRPHVANTGLMRDPPRTARLAAGARGGSRTRSTNGLAATLRKHPEFKGMVVTRRGDEVYLRRKK